jgi:hypothetical protein
MYNYEYVYMYSDIIGVVCLYNIAIICLIIVDIFGIDITLSLHNIRLSMVIWISMLLLMHIFSYFRHISGYGKIKLNYSGTYIDKIKHYSNTLQIFSCNRCHIMKLENLSNSLIKLKCNFNNISKIENLPNSLIKLKCGHNAITRIENLPIGLQSLYIYNNKIIKIENIPSTLKQLICSQNYITKLENLEKLTSLELLNCASNKIKKIENLPKNLHVLNINYNPICGMTVKSILEYKPFTLQNIVCDYILHAIS